MFRQMPAQMTGRPVIRKQTDYGFYRPAAYQIANALADIPFSSTRILIYDIIIYFMVHLDRSAGRFFTFHIVNYTAFLVMQGFFRTIGLFFSDFHSAYRVAVSIFPNLILYAGYMVPINQMKRWLFWIVSLLPRMGASLLITSHQFYINPVNYAWSALMENEFQRLSVCIPLSPPSDLGFNFSHSLLVTVLTSFPATPAVLLNIRMCSSRKHPSRSYLSYSVDLGPNQICTLFGARSGSVTVSGRDYIKAGYGLDVDDLWRRNFIVLVGFLVFFSITQTVVIEIFPVSISRTTL